MKKIIVLVMLALVLLVCVSCSQGEPADTTETDNVTTDNSLTTELSESTEESTEEVTTEESTEESIEESTEEASEESESESDTSEDTDIITQDTEEEYHEEPMGYGVTCRTYEDLLNFSSWGNVTSEQWEKDKEYKNRWWLSYDEAMAAFKKVSESPIPLPKDANAFPDENFGVTYYECPNRLYLIYVVDDVYYSFSYMYDDRRTEPYKYEDAPVLTNAPFFNTTIDLYLPKAGDGDRYVTTTLIENVFVIISVYKKGGELPSLEEISFDNFNFVNISELSEK